MGKGIIEGGKYLAGIIAFTIILVGSEVPLPVAAAIAAVAGVAGSFLIRKNEGEKDSLLFQIDRQPLQDASKAVKGVPIAVEGTIAAAKTLTSPYTRQACVYFHVIIEKYVKTKDSSYWSEVENKWAHTPFAIADAKGELAVDLTGFDSDLGTYGIKKSHERGEPGNSEIDAIKAVYQKRLAEDHITITDTGDNYTLKATRTQTKWSGAVALLAIAAFVIAFIFPLLLFLIVPLVFILILVLGVKGFADLLGNRKSNSRTFSGELRITEYVLLPGEKVFAYGRVNEDRVLREAPGFPVIISRKTKNDYLADFAEGDTFFFTSQARFAAAFAFAGIVAFMLDNRLGTIVAVILAGAASFLLLFGAYNRIVELSQRIENSQSQIDIELQRRSELLPNLVTAVKEYAKYEKNVQGKVAELRALLASPTLDKTSLANYDKTVGVTKQLFAIAEKYPKLSANESFRELSSEITDTENRIAHSRSFRSRTAMKYNTLVQSFPYSLIAELTGNLPRGYQ